MTDYLGDYGHTNAEFDLTNSIAALMLPYCLVLTVCAGFACGVGMITGWALSRFYHLI